MKQNFSFSKSVLAASITLASWSTFSAPGILEDLPLNLSTRVQPNILFLLDDSGSMDWEQLISASAQDAYGVNSNGSRGDLIFTPVNDTHVNELCLQYNLMAYNPNVVYEPWSNNDDDGNAYGDKTLTTALDNPYITNTPHDLSGHVYMSWVDANTDTVFDIGECGDYSTIEPSTLTPGGHTVYTMGSDTSSDDEVGYLVDSGDVGGNYSNNESFIFDINPDSGATQITIHFAFFDVEAGWDSLRILNQAGIEVAAFDGTTLPPSVTVNSPRVFIQFISDGWVDRGGFVLFWNHSTSGIATPGLGTVDPDLCRADDNCTVVADLPTNATAGTGVTNTQENYANWYTYYRKREYVAKKALSDIIDVSTSRLGLATLHNRGNAGTIIQNMQVTARKQELFDNLFAGFSRGGTPLRQNLEHVGRYFMQGDSAPNNTTTCPVGDDCVLFGFTPNHSGGDTVSTDSPIFNNANGGMCQQNFAVVFSDGFWNGSAPSIGDTDNTNNSGQEPGFDGGTFADAFSPTLADVAMNYLERDLSSSLPNVNNVVDVRNTTQTITHQHLTTYTVAFGLNGTLTVNPTDPAFTGWTDPTPNGTTLERIDDMRHAAWNGRGEFLSASDPQDLIGALTNAIEDIADRTGTASAASFNSGSISSDTLVFQSIFSTENWSGDLLAYRFDSDGIVNVSGDTDPVTGDPIINTDDAIWSANSVVSAQSSRSVLTYNGTQGVEFAFPSSYGTLSSTTLSSAQVTDILTNAPFNISTTDSDEIDANQAYGAALVDYLKGDTSNEITGSGGLFRNRSGNSLGPFVHSSPQFVGIPSDKYPNLIQGVGNEYSTFRTARQTRTPLVYVGGNDGMLHAFNANVAGGEEVFAYIPSFLVNNLHTLSEADYAHLAYVDSTPTVRDVFVNGAWRTFLVGGTRSGGRGIYTLDVTDPTVLSNPSNADSVVQFEFVGDSGLDVDADPSAGGDADLGFTYSRPQIAKMNDGSWVAIVANGYNSEGDGTAKLFIINLQTGAAREIDTGAGSIVNGDCQDANSDCNGLSSPAIADINGDFLVDRIYAGDLHGNMWVFNVEDSNPANWGVAFGGQPLFTACTTAPCTSANRQPITVKPEIVAHPGRRSFATSPNILVYFGTGQFLAENDDTDTTLQSFYAVWDAGSTNASSVNGDLDKSNLQQQSFSNSSGVIGVSNNAVDYTVTSELGWYIDLSVPAPNIFSGARAVINPLVLNQVVFFLVTIPSGETCNRDGDTFLVVLDSYNGTEPNFAVFDTDGDGTADSSTPVIELEGAAVGLGSISSGNDTKLVTTNADGSIDVDDVNTAEAIASGRKSWSILR